MKRLLFSLFLAFLLFSCLKVDPVQVDVNVEPFLTKTEIKDDNYAVTDKDIKNYLHFKQLENPKTAAKIPPIVEPSEETGYYELSISSVRHDYAYDAYIIALMATGI